MGVDWGLISKESVDSWLNTLVGAVQGVADSIDVEYYKNHPKLLKEYVSMTVQFIIWLISLVLVLFFVFLATEGLKMLSRHVGLKLCCVWPDEMRWWGRLLISMDNLTYF